jgi:DNA-directed RNA polymerase subunit N (RpoN/RPB10)
MKINCLSCGHKVDLDDVYDDYQGQVKCLACGALLEIRTEEAHLRMVKLVKASRHVSPEEALERAHMP